MTPHDQPTALRFQPTFDPDLRIQSGILAEILGYWSAKCAGREMPARRDIDPVELGRLLPYIGLVDVEHDPFRLRWRLIGTHITGATGRDNTGTYFDEAYGGALRDDMLAVYSRVLRRRRPVRHHGRPNFAGKDFAAYESIHLPLSGDGKTIDMIMLGFVFERPALSRDPFASF